jgi:hypothetical protein
MRLPANARLIAAVAAMLLVVIGFTLVFRTGIGQRGSISSMETVSTATTAATPSPTPFNYGQPAHPLTWRQVSLPSNLSSAASPNISPYTGLTAFTIAPNDAATAYLWGPSTAVPNDKFYDARQWSLWATHDGGAHWTQVTAPPVTMAGPGSLLVDELNVNILLAETLVRDPPLGNHVAQRFISRDGGASWQSRSFTARPPVSEIATWGGVAFGLVGDQRDPNGGAASADNIPFARSDDGMRTWQAVDQPITATGQWVTRFWANSRTGAILARTNQAWLWETRDLGAHWTRLPEAGPLNSNVQYIVQETPASDLWHICAFINDGSSDIPSLQCTQDSGRDWEDRANISISIPCPVCAKGKPGNVEGIPTPVGIASDGAIIVADLGGLTSDYQWIIALYRLEPDATMWQSLGNIPTRDTDPRPLLSQGRAIWMVSEQFTGVFVAPYP